MLLAYSALPQMQANSSKETTPPAYSLSYLMNGDSTSRYLESINSQDTPSRESIRSKSGGDDVILRTFTALEQKSYVRTPVCGTKRTYSAHGMLPREQQASNTPTSWDRELLVSRPRFPIRKRTTRYLSEEDRRDIIYRIKNGELQCELAKEYSVSRAAICNLYKKCKDMFFNEREASEALMRYPMGKVDEQRDHQAKKHCNVSIQSLKVDGMANVFQLAQHSRPLNNLLRLARSVSLDRGKLRHTVDRLAALLLEEVFASIPRDINSHFSSSTNGKFASWDDDQICAISMEQNGGEILQQAFKKLCPSAKNGRLSWWKVPSPEDLTVVKRSVRCDATNIAKLQCFLFAITCTMADDLYIAVDHLVNSCNVPASNICVVVILSSMAGAQRLLSIYPQLTIMCAANQSDLETEDNGRSDVSKFLHQYFDEQR